MKGGASPKIQIYPVSDQPTAKSVADGSRRGWVSPIAILLDLGSNKLIAMCQP